MSIPLPISLVPKVLMVKNINKDEYNKPLRYITIYLGDNLIVKKSGSIITLTGIHYQ